MANQKTFLVHIVGLEYKNNGEEGNGGGSFEWRFNHKDADFVYKTMLAEKKKMVSQEPTCKVSVYRTSYKIEGIDKKDIDTITEVVENYLQENDYEKAFEKNEGRKGTQRSPFGIGS